MKHFTCQAYKLITKSLYQIVYYTALVLFHMFTSLAIVKLSSVIQVQITQAVIFTVVTLLCTFDVLSLNFSIWFFLVLSMTSLVLKITLTQCFPGQSLRFFQEEDTQGEQIRRRSGPQSMNHRRIGRNYYLSSERRRTESSNRSNNEIPMTEIRRRGNVESSSQPRLYERVSQFSDQRIPQRQHSDSPRRRRTRATYHSRIFSIERNHEIHQLEQERRRAIIRNEFLRLLQIRQLRRAGFNRQLFLRNLEYLQLAALNRDFNENDYEVLAALDNSSGRSSNSEQTQIIIASLPTYIFASTSKCMDENDDVTNEKKESKCFCTICLENFQKDENIKILPCFHQFHTLCVDNWLQRRTVCPVCKYKISDEDFNIEDEVQQE